MLEPPHVTRTPVQLTACVHVIVPRAQIRDVMGPGLDEVRGALAAQRIAATGPWLTHHLRLDPDVFDFEICVPVPITIVAAGRVKAGKLRATRVAQTVYRGPYEGLADAWGEFTAWIVANAHSPAPDFWERYLVGPESGRNDTEWRTELTRPLSG